MNICVIGYGGRGRLYTSIAKDKNAVISAVCDTDKDKLSLAKKELNLTDDKLYDNEEDFFNAGKLGDILFVCTQDELHIKHAIKGLNAGYDLLLEKPIATSIEHCKQILKLSTKLNRKVFVCHVLRYAPFFSQIKNQLDSGKFGNVITMNMTENVAFWHQAHSYVRGNWNNDKISSPMIVAKCCHDLDIISWFMATKCSRISSFGSLTTYTSKNAPNDCADYCLDCKYTSACPYSAEKIYILNKEKDGVFNWPCDIVVNEPTKEKLYKALKTSKYGRCVYKCDNNVVDQQIVNMQFENGSTASLMMTAFSKDCYRELHIHCEKGEIYGNMTENILHCNIYGGESFDIDVSILKDTAYGHGGGDKIMLDNICNYYEGKKCNLETSIANSMQSHFMGFSAELSRINNGQVIELENNIGK